MDLVVVFSSKVNLNKKIVAVSGYFDPLHIGHLEYFHLSKALGDFLYVIVNNDKQAFLKKGSSFMNESDRVEIIRSLKIVDNVILSIDNDLTVSKTLKLIKPHIFANGGDQLTGSIREEEICLRNNIEVVGSLGKKIRSSSDLTGIKSR